VTSHHPVRIRLRHADLDVFVEKFAPNVTRGGVFLATRHPQPVGAVVPFEIQLASGQVVMSGQGKVIWVREFNPAEPGRPHGIGVQFVALDNATKLILARILKHKETLAGVSGPAGSGARDPAGVAMRPTGAPGDNRSGPTVTLALPVVDTGVDLAAELGVDPTTLRSLIDRTWMSSARSDDDLSELLKPESPAQATLAQALGDLPRFLGSQGPRRRATGRYRTTEALQPASLAAARDARGAIPPAVGASPSDSAVPTERPRTDSDITDMTSVSGSHETGAGSRDPGADRHLG
jgi:uncharacterized protein (TIGR02266 family)